MKNSNLNEIPQKVEIYRKRIQVCSWWTFAFKYSDRWRARVGGGRLYESSRAVNMVDGLPHAPSFDSSLSFVLSLAKGRVE